MRKKGFFTSVLMLLAMVPGNLHAKAKAKQVLQVCIQQLKTTDLQLLQKK